MRTTYIAKAIVFIVFLLIAVIVLTSCGVSAQFKDNRVSATLGASTNQVVAPGGWQIMTTDGIIKKDVQYVEITLPDGGKIILLGYSHETQKELVASIMAAIAQTQGF